jgi:hypothetical protein
MNKAILKITFWIAFLVAIFIGILAYAQIRTKNAEIVTQRKQAEINYDTAKNFYLNGKYEEAATYFLKADILLPSEIALVQAFRSYHRADKRLKAQEIALVYMYRYSGQQLPNARLYTDIVCVRRDELESIKGRLVRDSELFDDLLKSISFVDVDIFKRRLTRNVAVVDSLLNDRPITDIPANPF